VKNASRLEREMDQAWVGTMKLYVNIPCYRRAEQERPEYQSRAKGVQSVGKVNVERTRPTYEQREENKKEEWRVKKGKEKMEGRALNVKQTYAGAVKKSSQGAWKGPMIETKQIILPWMRNSAVGFIVADLSYN